MSTVASSHVASDEFSDTKSRLGATWRFLARHFGAMLRNSSQERNWPRRASGDLSRSELRPGLPPTACTLLCRFAWSWYACVVNVDTHASGEFGLRSVRQAQPVTWQGQDWLRDRLHDHDDSVGVLFFLSFLRLVFGLISR